jgi:hypothetical protein
MKSFGDLKKTTPLALLHEGTVWLSIWENTSKEAPSLLPATYCLFTALELYMKAYLVLKNNKYADTTKLKKELRHNFGTIYEKIVALEENNLTREINTQINKYELRNINLDGLKYPQSGRVWTLDRGLEQGQHTLKEIFQKIDSEITANFDQWLKTTYPKKTEISAMVQIGYSGNPKKINLETLSNTCSECLPANIIVLESYNYPWNQELILIRICRLCKKIFDPNGTRPNIFK